MFTVVTASEVTTYGGIEICILLLLLLLLLRSCFYHAEHFLSAIVHRLGEREGQAKMRERGVGEQSGERRGRAGMEMHAKYSQTQHMLLVLYIFLKFLYFVFCILQFVSHTGAIIIIMPCCVRVNC